MIIELRRKSQITIPKEIINELNLIEGDHLEINVVNGVIHIQPVAIYSKAYVEKLEQSVMMINEDVSKYSEGPFSSVEEAIEYLESKNNNQSETNEKKLK